MKANLFLFSFIIITIPATILWGPKHSQAQASLVDLSSPSVNRDYARLSNGLNGGSLIFVENVGQFPDYIRFKAHQGKSTVWLLDNELWVSTIENRDSLNNYHLNAGILNSQHMDGLIQNESLRGMNHRMSFPGANPDPRIESFDPVSTHISYFIGNDSEKWITNVPAWGGVRYIDIYPGIDLEITGANGQLTQKLIVSDSRTRLMIGDFNLRPPRMSVRVDGDGTTTFDGDINHLNDFLSKLNLTRLQAVRETSNPGVQVRKPFAVSTPNSQYNIPSSSGLIYSTFLGGSGIDWVTDLALGTNGEISAAGGTYSPEFPTTPGAFDTTFNVGEAWVVKINPNTSSLDYATFLGGSKNDWAESIAVSENGMAVIAGGTESLDFPTTPGAFDTSHNNPASGSDGFIAKLNSSATDLVFATYLGGGSGDGVRSLFLDSIGDVYVSGTTMSTDFPTTPGAFDTTFNGGSPPFLKDGFVAKLNQSGSSLIYSTFLGGSGSEEAEEITVDESGSAYAIGLSTSPDFPTTSGAFDISYNDGFNWGDAFLVKLDPDGSDLAYATYLGGGGDDMGNALVVDDKGTAYVAGTTISSDFPATPGAFDTTFNGGTWGDVFVAKFDRSGSNLIFASYIGGSGSPWLWPGGIDISIDESGAAYIAGSTSSIDFPTTPTTFDNTYGGCTCSGGPECDFECYDGFVAKVKPGGDGLNYATYLGGGGGDTIFAIAVDESGHMYLGGRTSSPEFPITPGAFDPSLSENSDAFVAELILPKVKSVIYLPLALR